MTHLCICASVHLTIYHGLWHQPQHGQQQQGHRVSRKVAAPLLHFYLWIQIRDVSRDSFHNGLAAHGGHVDVQTCSWAHFVILAKSCREQGGQECSTGLGVGMRVGWA